MTQPLDQLLELLDLETLEVDLYRGGSPRDRRRRIFGGQVLAQGLVAAGRTVEGRAAHSLHAYFLRPGNPEVLILYDVDRIRDGRSFTTRRVRARQRGEAIFTMSVSFQVDEAGPEHQIEMPQVPGPEQEELYEEELRREIARRGFEVEPEDRRFELPIELRTVGGLHLFDEERRSPRTHTWMRTRGKLPDDPAIHRCVLAYGSDLTLLASAVRPHGFGTATPGVQAATLDHAMWFHRSFRADEWLLFEQDSPVSAGARGFARGTFYTRDGLLVASCTQEGLLRTTGTVFSS